jgi:hypothetical protein
LEIQPSNGYAEVDFVEKSPVFIDFGLKAAAGGRTIAAKPDDLPCTFCRSPMTTPVPTV